MHLLIYGESVLHRLEAAEPGSIAAAIQAATQDLGDADLWIEQVRLDLQSPPDRNAAAGRTDAVGEVVRLVDAIGTDGGHLKAWFLQQVAEMTDLPGALGDPAPFGVDLPVLLNDVLMTSDEDRSGAILEAMADFADENQVLVFTHHRHMVELAQRHVPAEQRALVPL